MISVPLRTRRQQRAQLAQKIQHAAPSFVLLGDGLTRLTGEHGQSLLLGAVEVIAAGLVIGTVARGVAKMRSGKPKGLPPPPQGLPADLSDEARRAKSEAHGAKGLPAVAHGAKGLPAVAHGAKGLPAVAHGAKAGHGVDWIDICIGGMLLVEAYMHFHETGHVARPTLLLATVMLALGTFHGRITAFANRRRAMRVSADGISIPGRLPFTRLNLPWADVASVDIDGGIAHVVAIDGRKRRIDVTDSLDPEDVRQALIAAKAHHDQFKAAQALQANETPA